MKIAIIGVGKMGSLFLNYLKDHDVYAYDKDIDKLKQLDAKIIELDDLKEMDLVIIAVPLESTSKVINDIARYMSKGSRLMEIASIKYYSYKALIKASKKYDLYPLSIHPLFGEGLRSFKDARIALIPINKDDNQFIKSIFKDARIIEMSIEEHERAMAIVLGLTHLSNFIIAKSIIDEDYTRLKEIGGSTFRLQSILLESVMNDPPSLSIPLMINPIMKRYAKRLKKVMDEVYNDIIEDDREHLAKLYNSTRDKFSDLDKSYRLMYDILSRLNNIGS